MSREWVDVRVEGAIAEVVLRRPPHNVLNRAMIAELREAVSEAVSRKETRVLFLRGEGKSFCAGVNIGDHMPGKFEQAIPEFDALAREIADAEVPSVAFLHGNVLGGGLELGIATDLAYAAAGAKLGQPEIKLAVFPPFAAALAPSILGARRAAELVLTGKTYTAAEARDLGLVNAVFADEEAEAKTREVVRGIASLSRPALVLAKKALRCTDRERRDRLAEAERIYVSELMKHSDPVEGLTSFLEKRPPTWRDS